jgi:putative nucleotidyltransferase with HDIG domain
MSMNPSFLEVIAPVCRRLRTEPFLVGGTVRDKLLGRPSHDWDFVCERALPAAKAIAGRLSAKLITLDEQHRIYRIVMPDRVTLDFAERQGKTLEHDLARRDFSINAMAMPLSMRTVIDPFGGQKDLKKRVLRALSRKAFQEDPLRLLRAYRLAAQFNLTIAASTLNWIQAEHRLLKAGGVARERVREEFLRLLSQPASAPALEQMDRSGLLTVLFPELEAGRRVGQVYYGKGGVVKHHLQSVANVEWLLEHVASGRGVGFIKDKTILTRVQSYAGEPVGGHPRAALLKLGALLHDVGKPATAEVIRGRLRFFGHEEVGGQMVGRMLEALRCSRQEASLIRLWVRNHMRPGSLANAPQMTDKAMARFFRDMGEDGVGMLIVSLGDHYTYLARSKWAKGTDPVERTAGRLLEAYYLHHDAVLPPKVMDGHALMKKLRLKPGPLIGELLEAIRDAQSEGKVRTAEDALAYARKRVTSAGGKASPRRVPNRSA